MGIPLSNKHGVNPSVTFCPLCGEDIGVALLGRLPDDAEAPRNIPDREPCDKCKKEIEHWKEIGFAIFVIADEYEALQNKNPRSHATPWQYFRWVAVLKIEAARKCFKDFDLSKRAAFISESVAGHIGLTKPTDGRSV